MQRGVRRLPQTEKESRGTLRPHREISVLEVTAPNELPHRPEWLTTEGEEVWLDDVGRVEANRFVSERDSTTFGNYCNLQGMIIRAWRAGESPPIAALSEVRKMQELFGIAGAKSRVKVGAPERDHNPFARNGRRV